MIPYIEKYKEYPIRRLNFANIILMERIIQTKDIDLDDFIISKEFHKSKLPNQWVTKMTK